MNGTPSRSDQRECRHERYPRKQTSASSQAPCLSGIDVAHEDVASVRNATRAMPQKIPSCSRNTSWSRTAGTNNVMGLSGNIDITTINSSGLPGSIPQQSSQPTHHPTNLSDHQDTWWLERSVALTAVFEHNATQNPPLCITTSAPHLNGSWSGGGPNVESTINLPPAA